MWGLFELLIETVMALIGYKHVDDRGCMETFGWLLLWGVVMFLGAGLLTMVVYFGWQLLGNT